jgi:phosphopantetheinyl transferase
VLLEIDAERAPRVELLHAGDHAIDEAALKARTREWAAARPAGGVSRSYCFPYALVAWHGDRVGVDIERIAACDERFARSICTPAETELAPWRSDEEIVSLWSGKEALAKALGDALRYDPRRLDSPTGWAGGASGPWRARRVPVPGGYCAWVCWRT